MASYRAAQPTGFSISMQNTSRIKGQAVWTIEPSMFGQKLMPFMSWTGFHVKIQYSSLLLQCLTIDSSMYVILLFRPYMNACSQSTVCHMHSVYHDCVFVPLYWLSCIVATCVFHRLQSEPRKERRENLPSWSLWVTDSRLWAARPEQVHLKRLSNRDRKLSFVTSSRRSYDVHQ